MGEGCCTGYHNKEYVHTHQCVGRSGGCCADNAVHSKAYGGKIGTVSARAVNKQSDQGAYCGHCFSNYKKKC